MSPWVTKAHNSHFPIPAFSRTKLKLSPVEVPSESSSSLGGISYLVQLLEMFFGGFCSTTLVALELSFELFSSLEVGVDCSIDSCLAPIPDPEVVPGSCPTSPS